MHSSLERSRVRRHLAVLAFALASASTALGQGGIIGTPPSTPFVPPANPMTPAKITLGKMLFWEEQMSVDNTMSCGTCHFFKAGGADFHAGRLNPGPDGSFNTPDDLFGSPGVLGQDAAQDYIDDPAFGVTERVTGRNAPTVIGAAFFRSLFWDIRAQPPFIGQNVTIPAPGGGLENQVTEPPISPVEMGHDNIMWSGVEAKLASATPMKLATNLPADIVAALAGNPSYAQLFDAAFGGPPPLGPSVSRERVAMAVATYMRTLLPDQTPFDLGLMTPSQQNGLTHFLTRGFDFLAGSPLSCTVCHTNNGIFSDGQLHNTQLPNHSLAVKTPTLKNIGLRKRFMHSGQFTTIQQVISFYNGASPQGPPRFGFNPPLTDAEFKEFEDFLVNGLLDRRLAGGGPFNAPFDRPTLHSESNQIHSNHYGFSWPGTGLIAPIFLGNAVENIGHKGFKFGIGRGNGGATAFLFVSSAQAPNGTNIGGVPIFVDLTQQLFLVTKVLSGVGAGTGVATHHLPLPNDNSLVGMRMFAQWFVGDALAIGGFSATSGASFRIF